MTAAGLCLMCPACFDPKFGRRLLAGLDVVEDLCGADRLTQVTLRRMRTLLAKVAEATDDDVALVTASALVLGATVHGVSVAPTAARRLVPSCR